MNKIELEQFLKTAVRECYLGDFKKAERIERPGFFEMEYTDGAWNYRDSFSGYYLSTGQEIVRYKDMPVWSSNYGGGVMQKYIGDQKFFKQVEHFLIESLSQSKDDKYAPRGPKLYESNDWKYECNWSGTMERFKGEETIFFKGEKVFLHDFFGGLVVGKDMRLSNV